MSPRKPKTDQQRLPRTKRAKKPPRIQITERDVKFLRSLLTYRFLTIEQYYWLFPDASKQKLQTRLKLMFHHKFLNRALLPVSKSANKMIYSLTEKGAQLIAEMDGIGRDEVPWSRHLNKVTPTHINHLLTINKVLIAYRAALAEAEAKGEVESFKVIRAESKRNRLAVTMRDADGRRRQASVVPDAILPIIFKGRNYGLFFIEVDRATMTTKRWQDKVAVYREYARSPDLKKKWQANWFILLTVTTSARRIDSLASATIQAGGKRGYWFATFEQVAPDTAMGKLWTRASNLYDIRNEKLISLAKPSKTKLVSLTDALGRNHG
jgi:hypothetical protein